MIKPIEHSTYYTWAKNLSTVGAIGTTVVTKASYSVVASVALSILTASHFVSSYTKPNSLLSYLVVKLGVTALLATISAVALLSLAALPVTLLTVAQLAGVLAAPSFIETAIETVLLRAKQPSKLDIAFQEGLDYYLGIHEKKEDVDRAFTIFEKLSKKGYLPAKVYLGVCYYNGFGCTKSLDRAERLFRESQNHPDGKAELGGILLEKNEHDRGLALVQASAREGSQHGLFKLAVLHKYDEKMELAEKYFIQAAKKGLYSAMVELCCLYDPGQEDNPHRSSKQYFKWNLELAQLGDRESILHVIQCYNNGVGVKINLSESRWWQKRLAQLAL